MDLDSSSLGTSSSCFEMCPYFHMQQLKNPKKNFCLRPKSWFDIYIQQWCFINVQRLAKPSDSWPKNSLCAHSMYSLLLAGCAFPRNGFIIYWYQRAAGSHLEGGWLAGLTDYEDSLDLAEPAYGAHRHSLDFFCLCVKHHSYCCCWLRRNTKHKTLSSSHSVFAAAAVVVWLLLIADYSYTKLARASHAGMGPIFSTLFSCQFGEPVLPFFFSFWFLLSSLLGKTGPRRAEQLNGPKNMNFEN